MSRRAHCRCTEIVCLTYEEAAALLKCGERWLRDNRHKVPHQKRGETTVFCPCELRMLQELTTVLPDSTAAAAAPATPAADLRMIRPAQGRGRVKQATG
jgi:hypothetical protein